MADVLYSTSSVTGVSCLWLTAFAKPRWERSLVEVYIKCVNLPVASFLHQCTSSKFEHLTQQGNLLSLLSQFWSVTCMESSRALMFSIPLATCTSVACTCILCTSLFSADAPKVLPQPSKACQPQQVWEELVACDHMACGRRSIDRVSLCHGTKNRPSRIAERHGHLRCLLSQER